ncbi:MAG: hypothetical protein R6X02_31180 [Enhygromyxa sp.]
MSRRELEAALRRDPGDEQAWAVFGDLLAELGDPRGELIALEQRAQASERPFERALLEHQAGELFEREHRRWLGPLADAGLEVVWQRGFAVEVVIARSHASTLATLLELPTSALLRRVVLVRPRSLARVAKLLAASDARSIEALVIRGHAGDSLEPLASLESLTELSLEGAALAGIAPLTALPRLRDLILRRCEGELRGLAGFHRLQTLEVSAHARAEQLGPDPLAPLAALVGLRELDLGDSGWPQADALAGLIALERLDLRSTGVVRLEPLRELLALRELNLSGCTGLSDLEPLAGLVRLERLRLGYTRVRDLRPLARLERLAILELAGTPVSDLSPLHGLPALTKLGLEACEVHDVAVLVERGVAVHGIRPRQRSWREVAEEHLRRSK